ncbi:MAG: response regulator [Spirochaetes bacterium]|nr:response regulator [Spirochaetota bacterium]
MLEPSAANDLKNTTIMLVEDEAITAMDIQRMLEKIGYSVPITISSGEESVRTALAIKPDLILMDIMLSEDMDGIEAAELIRQHADIPIIYLTASTDPTTIKRAEKTKHYGYLMKPIDRINLQTTISTALRRHNLEVEKMNSGK